MSDNQLIKSVGKGFALLELLVRSSDPLTLTQIARELGHTKTTAQRFINTLIDLGYIKRIDNKKYVLGSKVLTLSFQLMQKDNIYKQAQISLEQLADNLNYSVTLSVLEGDQVLVIYRKEKARYLPYAIYTGSRLPLNASSTGKALLASVADEELPGLLDRVELNPVTPKSIITREGILAEIQNIRQRGYSVSDQEYSLDLYSIGIPLLDGMDRVVAAAGLSLPIADKDEPEKLKSTMDSFLKIGGLISRGLGYQGPYPKIVH